ncbi:hypothetical protein HPC49_29895 [Pyxidicoccus fallax]|uniref:HEAT repeat domain-containing protein n=1 Tax=Pyxidicoccus fallax TaxID=394095 RepID=A0A848L713_9BACT|nr:HEAT repeat domain-containing protein [Pyxidicoccus fallax]NMO14317.1 hypothetical protein [Pyxidicoccus fallax]NPC82421.1 hypothetical protein [Pyxidicoccus fallax]
MSSIPSLVWSSRESIRAQLLSLLETTPSTDSKLRQRVVSLLGIFGGPEDVPLLRALLFSDLEDYSVQNVALWNGVKLGLRLSGPELARLLARESPHGCGGHTHLGPCTPTLEDFIPLATTEETLSVIETTLHEASAYKRARVLASADDLHLPSHLVERLYTRWYTSDRQVLAAGDVYDRRANLDVAVAHRARPEAWSLIEEWLRELEAEDLIRPERWDLSEEELGRLFRVAPSLHRRALESLLLPPPELLAHFGLDALLRRLRRVMRAASVGEYRERRISPLPDEFPQAVSLLVEWREARPLLASLLCDFNLSEKVRRELLNALFDHDRARVIRWAHVASRYPDNAPLVRFVLLRAARQPEPGDRALFLAALRGPDDEARAFALAGLFALGETGAGWCDRLTSLVHSDHPRVRLGAAACLAREGRREWLPLLRQEALEPSEPRLRAEAVHWLARVDAEASRPVLMKLLAEEDSFARGSRIVGEDEVVWALSRLRSNEDLSALLDAATRSWSSPLMLRVLRYHLARQEGHPVEDIPPPLPRWNEYDVSPS